MNYLVYFILMIFSSIIIWGQTVAPIRFATFLDKYTFLVYMLSLVTGILYVEATKIGASIFNDAWTLRIIAFSVNTVIFAIMTHFLIQPQITTKNLICIFLSVLIILVQWLWD
jgi:hypothetical protein